ISRTIGRKRMMEMLLTGDPVPALEALAAGLINKVVPGEHLGAAVAELAGKIAALSPTVTGIGKSAFYKQIDMPVHEAYAYTAKVMAQNALTADAHEGISAFLEKRAPRWP
ncbi:MAG TPA: enoyl-CoA hydratase-related protein, partial [Candidatus Acidoferrales bacterium]|nr:enoyl-CoA hydratase-related protein [Candidatus Acidoferrales bacterium]